MTWICMLVTIWIAANLPFNDNNKRSAYFDFLLPLESVVCWLPASLFKSVCFCTIY